MNGMYADSQTRAIRRRRRQARREAALCLALIVILLLAGYLTELTGCYR